MRRNNLLRRVAAVLLTGVMAMTMLAGCSKETGNASGTTTGAESGNSASDGKTVVKVGIGNAYSPFCFLDENEKEAGYDYDTIMSVADLLSDKYTFEIYPDVFQNLLVGLDTGAYDIAIHHFGYTEERAKNYLYATEGNMYIPYFVVAYPEGTEGITDLASCAGRTIVTSAGSKAENMLLTWNEEHPDAVIDIQYAESTEVIPTGLANGLYDAYLLSEYDLVVFNQKYSDTITLTKSENESDWVAVPNSGIYFVYSNGSDALAQDIDAAIAELRSSGKLAELSIKWLGEDFSQKE